MQNQNLSLFRQHIRKAAEQNLPLNYSPKVFIGLTYFSQMLTVI